jgi:N-dimethylarginine dimethylaminohydrolase
MSWRRAVLMGDPAHFRIRGGANPHTRTRWGFRKSVDLLKATAQWHALARLLRSLDVEIYVLPPRRLSPGMVFPANAGFLTRPLEEVPPGDKDFILSTALPSRAAEKEIYRDFAAALGFQTVSVPRRFEGEADLFEAGGKTLFTSGPLERQRFVPRLGWPPWRRVYGFRSDPAGAADLAPFCAGGLLPLTLVRETHYHGDTCLCAFGARREYLMAYLPALDEASRARLRGAFGERLLELSPEDGELFSANAFQVDGPRPVLVMPATATERLRRQVAERGVAVETADVSEFMSKGGGSVKCMIGDLGVLPAGGTALLERKYDFLYKDRAG